MITRLAVHLHVSGDERGREIIQFCSPSFPAGKQKLSSFAQTPQQQSGEDTVNRTTAKLNKYRQKSAKDSNQSKGGIL